METNPEMICGMLEDAACSEDPEIEKAIRSGDLETARCLMRRKRCELLQRLHESQKCLDSLDYILYQMEKMIKR